jgi:hypothetical protein
MEPVLANATLLSLAALLRPVGGWGSFAGPSLRPRVVLGSGGLVWSWATLGCALRVLSITLTAMVLTGCCCLRDARGPSDTCEVHHTAMKTASVPGWGGCRYATTTYAEARPKLFPHTYPFRMPSPWPWKRERISLCDDCIGAEQEWGKAQP